VTVKVEPGDQLIFQTAGGGGGVRIQREAKKFLDVVRESTIEKACRDYGVVINEQTEQVDEAATTALREKLAKERGLI
jgi:N-methylhydantoinase B/oxoprolinase/acetone carboxylase alpha subunit